MDIRTLVDLLAQEIAAIGQRVKAEAEHGERIDAIEGLVAAQVELIGVWLELRGEEVFCGSA